MLVQPGLCGICSETTLLVFPRGGSYVDSSNKENLTNKLRYEKTNNVVSEQDRHKLASIVTEDS